MRRRRIIQALTDRFWPKRVKGEAKAQVLVSRRRLETAQKLAPSRLRRSPALLVEQALLVWSIARRRKIFHRGWAAMAKNPQTMAIERQLNEELSAADNDGLLAP